MKATIKAKSGQYAAYEHSGKIASNRKEDKFTQEYVVLVKRKDAGLYERNNGLDMHAVIIARIYNTDSRAYACLWINSPTRKNRHSVSLSGGGYAGGYGYHKASAALQCAINDAQIELDESISGRGESAMTDALAAIAHAMGYRKFFIHNAHA